jgi:hypothetical protein
MPVSKLKTRTGSGRTRPPLLPGRARQTPVQTKSGERSALSLRRGRKGFKAHFVQNPIGTLPQAGDVVEHSPDLAGAALPTNFFGHPEERGRKADRTLNGLERGREVERLKSTAGGNTLISSLTLRD